jgi:Tol biopolymer transport system component
MPVAARTRVATDGNAVSFASLAGFGDVVGTGVAVDYMALRSGQRDPGSNGWTTHAITPPQQQMSFVAAAFALDPLYESDFSPDLSRGIFRAWSLLGSAPNVKNVENLYLRADLRTPGAGSYQLLSDAISPVGSDVNPGANLFKPFLAGTSADFEHVIFESRYSLTSDATGGGPWLYEWEHGTLRVANVRSDGTVIDGAVAGQGAAHHFYTPQTISADGLKIFFTDLSTGVNGNDGVLYMRQTDAVSGARTAAQLNASERTVPDPSGPFPATYWDASVDGSRVFFTTAEALTDDAPANGQVKLYMYDTTKHDTDAHNLTLLSNDAEPADGSGVDGVIGASTDGHYVYFAAAGQLVAGAPVLGTSHGVYLWHDGLISYAGELANAADLLHDLPGDWSLNPTQARVTPDGKQLLFMSTSGVGLDGADHGSCPSNGVGTCREFYVYSADSGRVACASCNPGGAPPTADAAIEAQADAGASNTVSTLSRAISDDGRRVFFNTADALVPGDTNHRIDPYEYDVPTGTVHLLSTGKDPSDSYFLSANPSGDDAFIVTRQRLVGWDTDGAYDLYDARVGGGFPEPTPAPAPCSGDACHGAPSGAPSAPAPGSTLVNKPSRHTATAKHPKRRLPHCKRGFVRKRVHGKVRCVKRPRPHARHASAKRKAR